MTDKERLKILNGSLYGEGVRPLLERERSVND